MWSITASLVVISVLFRLWWTEWTLRIERDELIESLQVEIRNLKKVDITQHAHKGGTNQASEQLTHFAGPIESIDTVGTKTETKHERKK